MFGIWCGKDATVAAVEDFTIAFLRIRRDLVAGILRHRAHGTVGIVYGLGIQHDAQAVYCVKNPESGALSCNEETGAKHLADHAEDSYSVSENGEMVYRMYDGTVFALTLAEEIHMEDFSRPTPVDPALTLAQRMTLWNVAQYFEYGDNSLNAGFNTRRYSIYYSIFAQDTYVYCRVGQNGYCEKGWAMLSSTCIRQDECRMPEDNLQTLQAYRPMEECFVADGCSFPSDGGWYWSVKEVTEDTIYLNGCGGATYEIHRKK